MAKTRISPETENNNNIKRANGISRIEKNAIIEIQNSVSRFKTDLTP